MCKSVRIVTPTPTAAPTPSASYKPADATGKAQNVPVPVLPDAAKAETKEGLERRRKVLVRAVELLLSRPEISDPIDSRSRPKAVVSAERSLPGIPEKCKCWWDDG